MTRLILRFTALCLALALAGVFVASHLKAQQVNTPPQVGIACAYNTSPPTITNGNYLLAQCDATGHLLITAGGGSGGSVTQGTSPWVDDITQWANVALGAPSNYGTSPGTVAVPGVNAFVTNPVAVTGTFFQATQPVSGTFFQATQPVSIAGNQPVNLTQIGGAAPSIANPLPTGVNTGNATTTPHICGSHIFKHITTATDTQILAASGSTTIYVCDYSFSFNGTGNAYLEKATSGTCATLTQLTGAWYGVANIGKTDANPYYRGLNTGASAQLCVNTSAAVSFDIDVYYDQY